MDRDVIAFVSFSSPLWRGRPAHPARKAREQLRSRPHLPNHHHPRPHQCISCPPSPAWWGSSLLSLTCFQRESESHARNGRRKEHRGGRAGLFLPIHVTLRAEARTPTPRHRVTRRRETERASTPSPFDTEHPMGASTTSVDVVVTTCACFPSRRM